jgi:hypothetical protein
MQWQVARYAEVGDTRTKIRFCFFPRRCTDETTMVWLERVKVRQVYHLSWDGVSWDTYHIEPVRKRD